MRARLYVGDREHELLELCRAATFDQRCSQLLQPLVREHLDSPCPGVARKRIAYRHSNRSASSIASHEKARYTNRSIADSQLLGPLV